MVKTTTACFTLYGDHGKPVGSTLAKALECLEDAFIDLRLQLIGTITELLLLDASFSNNLLQLITLSLMILLTLLDTLLELGDVILATL